MAYELFFDGFEIYTHISQMTQAGYTLGTMAELKTTGRRNSKAFGNIATNVSPAEMTLIKEFPGSSCVVVGFALTTTDRDFILNIANDTAFFVKLEFTVEGYARITLPDNSTQQSSTIFPLNTFKFIELGVQIGEQTGAYSLRVNGTTVGWIPETVANTQGENTPTATKIELWNGIGETSCIDDLYITYGDELKFLGDSRIDRVYLTQAAFPQQWLPSGSTAVSKLNNDDGTEYVTAYSNNASSLFSTTPLTHNIADINGVAVRSFMEKSPTLDFVGGKVIVKSNNTVFESDTVELETTNKVLTKVYARDPATEENWTLEGLNSLLVGMKLDL